jgi:hypothetical protein
MKRNTSSLAFIVGFAALALIGTLAAGASSLRKASGRQSRSFVAGSTVSASPNRLSVEKATASWSNSPV